MASLLRTARVSTRFLLLLTLCLAAVLALPAVAHAADKYVAVTGNDTTGAGTLANPYLTVAKAITVAVAGDTVRVGPGIYPQTATITMKRGVSLRGAGAGHTTLWGNNVVRVLLADGLNAGEVLSGFTITGGRNTNAEGGGGILCRNGSTLTITGNTVIGNVATASPGGGIRSDNSSPTIAGNTIVNNSTNWTGGGIFCTGGAGPIANNTIIGNTAQGVNSSGGGIYCDGPSLTITGNTVSGNSAAGTTSYGGGICWGTGTATIVGNTVTGNRSNYAGGGIGSSDAGTIANNVISGNRAVTGEGGGIVGGGALTVRNNIITGNEAGDRGGGMFVSNLVSSNNVIAGNKSALEGGGIYVLTAGSVTNDTIVGNRTPVSDGGGIYSGYFSLPVANSILWDNKSTLSTYMNTYGCTVTHSAINPGGAGTTGCIFIDPAFVSSATGDYRLSAGSPCRDAADPAVAPATDHDGIGRPWGARPDMGAYEYYVPVLSTAARLSGSSSARVRKTLKLTGTVAAVGAPTVPAGQVLITKQRKVGRRWKSAGTARVNLTNGSFSYSFKPTARGSWRIYATYQGGRVGPTTYLSSKSSTKSVRVK